VKNKRKINSLDFSSENQVKKRKMRSFVLAFVSFVVVLGAVSILVFMKSIDFDIQNIVQKTTGAEASASSSETTVQNLYGRAGILLIFTDDSGKILSVSALDCDMSRKNIEVMQLSGESLSSVYSKSGASGLEAAVTSETGAEFTKYIKVTESQLKKLVSKIGDVTVQVPSDINYKGDDFTLLLDSGAQSLTSDLFCKYFMYADDSGRGSAVAALLNTLFVSSNLSKQDSLFNYIMNNSDTDISIVDYTKKSSVISAFAQYANGNAAVAVSSLAEVTENEK